MSKEAKIGILTFLVLVASVWGYTFLKGKNLFSSSNTYFTVFDDVTDLSVSSPVMINGYKVGTVTKISLDLNDVKKMKVIYEVEGDEFGIPKDAVVVMKSLGFVSGRGLFLEFDKVCSGADCAENNSELQGKVVGLLGSMLGEGDIDKYSSELTMSVKSIIASLGKEGEQGSINETVRNIELITKNLASLSAATGKMIDNTSQNLNTTMANMAKITDGIAKSNKNIEHLLVNLDKITSDLAKANLDQSVVKINNTMDAATESIGELKTTLNSSTKTLNDLSQLIKKMDSGDGSMAKLMNDKQLYNNLEATTKQMELLMQDLRLNPKRYAHFSVFGKKQKEFTLPEEDPANK